MEAVRRSRSKQFWATKEPLGWSEHGGSAA